MKKLLSLFLVIAMVVCTVPVVFAADLITGLSGEGTINSPVQIGSAEEWNTFAAALNANETLASGYYYELTADIDFDGAMPTYITNTFQSVLDGKNHVIKNYKIDGTQGIYALFTQVSSCTIKNIGFVDVTIVPGNTQYKPDTNYVAVVARNAQGNTYFDNAFIGGIKTEETITWHQAWGGFVGHSWWAAAGIHFNNCYFVSKVGKDSYVTADSMSGPNQNYFGPFVSFVDEANNSTFSFANCYTDVDHILPVVYNTDRVAVTNCYYNTDNNTGRNRSAVGYGTALTTTDLQSNEFVLSLGIDVYNLDTDDINAGYPVFDWQGGTEAEEPKLIDGLNGMGTVGSPVKIGSADDWNTFADALNADATLAEGKYYELTDDIDFGGAVPTYITNTFKSVLDGKNHVIKNYKIDGTQGIYALFTQVSSCTIKNIGFVDVTIVPGNTQYKPDTNYVAVVARNAQGNTFFDNAFISGIKTEETITWHQSWGGFVGHSWWAAAGIHFNNCYFVSKVGKDSYVTADSMSGPNQNYFGPFVSFVDEANNSTFSFTNCYTDVDHILPVVYNTDRVAVTNCYYNTDNNTGRNRCDVGYGTAKTTTELQGLASTLGVAYKTPLTDYFNGGYPLLAWESEDLPPQPEFNTLISTTDDLIAFAEASASSYNGLEGVTVILNADLDLGGMEWNDYIIGNETKPFKGTFDGNGHIISNFKMVEKGITNKGYGLFGAVGGNGVIKNVGVKNVASVLDSALAANAITYPGSCHAGVVAYALDDATIESCFAKNFTITTKNEEKTLGVQGTAAGGVIALIKGAGVVVENCYQYGFIEYNDSVGLGHGLIGGVAEGAAARVENCYSDEAITSCYTADKSKFVNCYAVKTTGWSMYGNLPGITKTATEMKTITTLLGNGFISDVYLTNNGYPMLSWELDLTALEGDGTENNPYLIVDIDTLAQVSLHTDTAGKYYRMANNIDFEGATLPSYIGSINNTFKGNFDGDGHVIRNYVIKAPVSGALTALGVFAAIGGDAVVENVGVENVTVTNNGEWGYNSRIGGLVALMYDNSSVTNCYARNVVFSDTSNGSFAIVYGGGLVGNMIGEGTIVKNCYATGVRETSAIVGSLSGLVGSADEFNYIANCYSDSTLTMVKVKELDDVTNSYRAKDDDGSALMRAGELVKAEDLKGKASALGSAFIDDSKSINGGYPILAWEANIETDKSTNANLGSLTVSQGTLTPGFDAATTNYSVSVENAVESITISATAEDVKAVVSGDIGESALEVGQNTFEIVVTAELNTITKTYTVIVTRASAEGGEGGEGGDKPPVTPEEPVVENAIATVDDLKALAVAVAASGNGLAGETYNLVADLDLNGATWTDYIGTPSKYFEGTFNGNGHIIKNYTVANTTGTQNGLFGCIGGNAVIKNLGVEAVTFVATGSENIGGIVSAMYGNSKVTGCFARDFVNNQYPASDVNFSIGGVVARTYDDGTVIENCYAVNIGTGNNTVPINNNGELFGCAVKFTRISNCYANGYLGVVYSSQFDKVTNCYFSSDLATSFYPGWYNPETSKKDGWTNESHAYVGYKVADSKLKTMAATLGNYFVFDKNNDNNKFPVLVWERDFDIVTNVVRNGNTITTITVDKINASAGKVVVAAYDSNEMLLRTVIADVTVNGGDITVNLDTTGAYVVKAFIVKDNGEATPISVGNIL